MHKYSIEYLIAGHWYSQKNFENPTQLSPNYLEAIVRNLAEQNKREGKPTQICVRYYPPIRSKKYQGKGKIVYTTEILYSRKGDPTVFDYKPYMDWINYQLIDHEYISLTELKTHFGLDQKGNHLIHQLYDLELISLVTISKRDVRIYPRIHN
jgi:hypothetical protein